jgi:transcriptional regulator with XRE-family HTH domain
MTPATDKGTAMAESRELEVRRYIGKRIKYARTLNDTSQAKLAQQLTNYTGQDFTREIVTNFETGRRAITVELLCAIAVVQDRSVSWYFQDAPSSLSSTIPGLLGLAPEPVLNAA